MKPDQITINPQKILIVKPSSLGDVVHSLPFLNAMKTCFPDAEIHWVIAKGLEGLLDGNPMIKRLWVINKDAWKKIDNAKNTVTEIKKFIQGTKKRKIRSRYRSAGAPEERNHYVCHPRTGQDRLSGGERGKQVLLHT